MADYDIFREQLAIKYPSYGYALWEPRPANPNMPVQVGDVGFICEGRFHRLFSALLPADDPSQGRGVPEYHEPLVPTLSDHVTTVPLSHHNYCSAGVRVEADPGYHSSPNDLPQVLFRNETTRAAAVISLPVTTRRENTLIRNIFGRWMVKHIDSWFAFARSLGLVHQMEEIILVTGCDLTRSWTNVAFLGGEADAQVSFGVKVEGPNTSIDFQFSPEHARGAVLRHGPEGTNLPENQCVFIRGFRVAPSLWILPKRLKAAAEPSPDPAGYDRDSDMEVISIPAITQFRDPLHLLSDYIAEQASDCDKVLVHDDDLLMIDGIGHDSLLETLEPDVMVNLLRKSDIKIHKLECDSFLTESQSGPNTDTSNAKVATLSMTSQNWNPTPPSQSPPLAAQNVDLRLLSHSSELRGTPQPTIPGNSSVPTFQRVSIKRKLSQLLDHDDSAPSTSQDLFSSVPPDRLGEQSAGHIYDEVSSGNGGLPQPTERVIPESFQLDGGQDAQQYSRSPKFDDMQNLLQSAFPYDPSPSYDVLATLNNDDDLYVHYPPINLPHIDLEWRFTPSGPSSVTFSNPGLLPSHSDSLTPETPPYVLTPARTPSPESDVYHTFCSSTPVFSHSDPRLLLDKTQSSPEPEPEPERDIPFNEHQRGPMVPQKRYKPLTSSDRRRYVDEVQLEPSIFFFMSNSNESGIPLRDALHGRFSRLVGRDEPMFEERGPSISLRINWPGYKPWSRQIPTRDFRSPPGPITRSKLAKNVAKSVSRFIAEHQGRPMEEDGDPIWAVGTRKIEVNDLVLVRLDHVSKDSWQAQFELLRPLHRSLASGNSVIRK